MVSEPGAGRITVFLADDNVIVREGVRALLAIEPDLEIVGDRGRLRRADRGRRPRRRRRWSSPTSACRPRFQDEGIDAAKELRKRHPGTGVVVLSQYDDPEYAISLLADGAAGLRLPPEGPHRRGQPARPGRPRGRDRRFGARPQDRRGARAPGRRDRRADRRRGAACCGRSREGRPIKAIAAAQHTTPAAVDGAVDKLFLELSRDASTGEAGALRRLRLLHQAIVDREEQGETLSRLLPERPRREGAARRPAHRRDRRARRDRAHVRHPRLLGHRGDAPTRPRSRTCSTSTAPR